jgi:hypothetical protein
MSRLLEQPLDDAIEECPVFMRDVEDVREVPFGLDYVRN